MDSRHVFISYQRKDRFVAETINEIINLWGYNVWMDQTSICGGSDWKDKIRDGIEKAFCMVVCATTDIKDSEWVQYEVKQACKQYIPIIPLVFHKPEAPFLSKHQGIDFIIHSKKDACYKLKKSLSEVLLESDKGFFYLECPELGTSYVLKRNNTYAIGRGMNVHIQFPSSYNKISRRHVLIETYMPPCLIAYGQNATYLNGRFIKGKVQLSLEKASKIVLAGYKEAYLSLTPIKDRKMLEKKESETKSLSDSKQVDVTKCIPKSRFEELATMDQKPVVELFQTNFTGTLVKNSGIKIRTGIIQKETIEFKRATMRAGKVEGVDEPAEIPIKGDYKEDHLFMIRQINGEFWVTIPKSSSQIRVNGVVITDGLQLQDGDFIEVEETKMQFFIDLGTAI